MMLLSPKLIGSILEPTYMLHYKCFVVDHFIGYILRYSVLMTW